MIDRAVLAAWVAGALDPARREEVARAVAVSPDLQRKVEELSQEIVATRPPAPRWRIPPPGLGLAVHATPVAVLDAAPSRVRVELPATERAVVLLRRQGAEWEVAAVLAPGPSIDLAVGEEWAVALAEPGWDRVADEGAAFAVLREGIAHGRVPVASIRT